MAGKFNSSEVKILIGVPPVAPATTISVWKGMAGEINCSFGINVNAIDVTDKYNDGWEESIPGIKSGSISGEAIVNNAVISTLYSASDLLAMVLARSIKTFRIGTTNDNDPLEEFKGFFTQFEKTADLEGAARYSFEIKVTTQPIPVAS